MGIFDFFKKGAVSNDRTLKTETFYAVGVCYYEENVKKLACCNPDWKSNAAQLKAKNKLGQKVFRYNFINKPVKLEPEPKNKHDKNAVMVIVAGEKVGYISRSENVHVKEILAKHEIKYISGFVSGGQYKIASEDGTIYRNEDELSVKVKIAYV